MFTINREKYSGKIPPSRYELDGKYKLVIDLSGKLDSQYRQVKNIKQLFSSNLNELRRQISEEISSIFRYAPIEYGRICEEILWKKNYYECVKFFKIFRRSHSTTTPESESNQSVLFRSHLISGIGHYNSLILSFRKFFHLANLDELIFLPIVNEKFPNFTLNNPFNNVLVDETSLNEQQHAQNEEQQTIRRFDADEDSDDEAQIDFDMDYAYDEKFKETLLFLINRFFICIGDLARYYSDFFGDDTNRFEDHYFKMASFYYKSASLVQPHLGMPYNQLGTLYIHSPYGLDTLYYYFRCLNSKKPFVGIKENLRQTFECVRKQSSHLNSRQLKSDNSRKNHQNHTNGFVTIKECDFQTDSDLVRTTLFRMIDVFALLFKLIDELAENATAPIPVEKLLIDLYETMVLFRNALNIESGGDSKLNPNHITIEQIFRMISIVMVLIDQIKMIFTKNSLEIDLGQVNDVLINCKLEKDAELETRGNFLLYVSYQFLFQMITMVVHRECETLKKILYASNNLMDDNPRMVINNKKSAVEKKNKLNNKSRMKKDAATPKIGQYSQSFSSDYGDQLDEAMSQLKNTAFQTIQDILDSSENEDEDLITFDDVNDAEIKLINHLNEDSNEIDLHPNYNDSKTFDQILAFIYTNSSITIIKFFCDYLQSNSDFMEILKNMPVLFEYFDHFFQYLNILSEFDFKSLTNFKHYLEQQFLLGNMDKDRLNRLMDLFNFINKCSHYSVKDFKQIWPLSSEMEYMNLTEELSSFYQPMFKCQNEISLMNLKNELSVEKSSYLCIRCLLIFGVKLSLLSLEKDKFKLMAQNLDLATVHNVKQNKHVSFVYELLQPLDSSSILKNDRYLIAKKINPDQQLISFDSNDKEVENACSNQQQPSSNSMDFVNQNHHANNEENKANTPNLTPTQGSSKSLYDLEKLPYIMIDPYVYLESIDQIKQIVQNKKAFLIVPKLVSDFLNNLSLKGIPAAIEAADFLQEEFFRGSRMIRFIRNEDRLELEMLNYPKTLEWRRTVDGADEWQLLDLANKSKSPDQDLALFYELLEHCHYLLVNKVLVNRRVPTIGYGFRGNNNPKSDVRITLITNNLSKWPPNSATTIAQTCGIDIETLDSYLVKQQNNKSNKTKNNVNKFKRNHNRQTRSPQSHFRPIQFVANSEMSAHRPVT